MTIDTTILALNALFTVGLAYGLVYGVVVSLVMLRRMLRGNS
jgi:hypothetical protein